MNQIFENLKNSFDNNNDGYSARKLTAFVITLCVIAAHIKWLYVSDLSQLEMVLTIDYGFIAALFGLTTYSTLKMKDKGLTDEEKKEASDDNLSNASLENVSLSGTTS